MKAMCAAMCVFFVGMIISVAGGAGFTPAAAEAAAPGFLADDPSPPAETVKLIFIHHSTGENWLADWDGGLGIALRNSNYFVSDTNYGWGPYSIGDYTDTGHWWAWYLGPSSSIFLSALYAESERHSSYSRLPTDPGGENQIILFKSCFPNSHISGRPTDPPTTGYNPLQGQDAWSPHMTVANVKGIYSDILAYFATRQNKLFILIVPPPLVAMETDAAHAANARAVADWLVNDWLDGYPYSNVAAFDFYNVLTSNGGDAYTNDLHWETGNHHRWHGSTEQHIQTVANDFAAYGSGPWDSHPTSAGNRKATGEFVEMLNVFYHRWQASTEPPSVGAFEPDGGRGPVGAWADFTTTYTDPNGYGDIRLAYFFLDPLPPITTGALAAAYFSPWDLLILPGGGYCRPGQAVSIGTAYVTLDCGGTSVSGAGDTLTVNWRVRPEQCFEGGCGENSAYELVLDSAGLWGFGEVGTWTLTAAD